MSPSRDLSRSLGGVRTNKFGAIKTEVDGITFASKKEAKRYGELKLLVRAGEIRELSLQPRFPLRVENKLICTYVADFTYETKLGETVVEDAKGVRTPVFSLKAKLFEALHGFPVSEV